MPPVFCANYLIVNYISATLSWSPVRTAKTKGLFLVAVFGDDGFAVGVEERGIPFFDIKSVFCHMDTQLNSNSPVPPSAPIVPKSGTVVAKTHPKCGYRPRLWDSGSITREIPIYLIVTLVVPGVL